MNTELLRRYRTGDTDDNVGTFWLIASALSQNKCYRESLELGQNGLGGLGPDERFGAGVVLGGISIDGGLQVGN
jgi:hypothetical protein